jgi:hypothetical protein
MVRSHLRWLNDDAVLLSYVRLTQKVINGSAINARCCETRLWQLVPVQGARWLNANFTPAEPLTTA